MLKWPLFIALSLAINGFFIAITQAETLVKVSPIKLIEINVIAVSRPAVKELHKKVDVVKQKKKVSDKTKLQKVVTKKQAKKKIKVVEKTVKNPVQKAVKIIDEPVKKIVTKPDKIIKKVFFKAKSVANINDNKGKDLTSILHKAKYKKQTAIIYPQRALKRGQQGKVVLKVHISKSGLPVKMEIKQSSGFSVLDKAAIKTVQTWEFEPQKKGDYVIKSWVLVPVIFEIKT